MAFQETELPTLSAAALDALLDETFGRLANDMANGTGVFDESPMNPDDVKYSHMTLGNMSTVVTRRDGEDVEVAPEHQAALAAMKESIARTPRKIGRITLSTTFQTPFDELGRSNDDLINSMLYLPRLVNRQSFAHLRAVAASQGWSMNFDAKTWAQGESLLGDRPQNVNVSLTFCRDALNFGQEFVIEGGVDSSSSLFPSLKRVPVKADG